MFKKSPVQFFFATDNLICQKKRCKRKAAVCCRIEIITLDATDSKTIWLCDKHQKELRAAARVMGER